MQTQTNGQKAKQMTIKAAGHKSMNKQEQQKLILSKIDAMVNAWNRGDVKESQKNYEYILGFCESAGYDFSATINGGLNRLMAKCVGIEDTKKYTQYINGVSNFHF